MKALTDHRQLSRIVIRGFKSIRECELRLGSVNIMIGCNGAGKSNFIDFFRMIRQILDRNLQVYVGKQGGPDAILHFGRRTTPRLSAELYFGNNGYTFTLEPTLDNRMMFVTEDFLWNMMVSDFVIASGHFESEVENKRTITQIYKYVVPVMRRWCVYHFHDTGDDSPIKRTHGLNDNVSLRANAGNLAAFLYLLKEKYRGEYQLIVHTIRLVAPFFGDFHLRPSPRNGEMIELEWVESGQDVPFKAHHLSDGTLRFISLATALLQPAELQPETILIDEPELGLHPYAIKVLADLIMMASERKQIIVSTQSVELINEFDPEDIIVVDRDEGRSVFHRVQKDELVEWLDEYSLGELWMKNILGGRPAP